MKKTTLKIVFIVLGILVLQLTNPVFALAEPNSSQKISSEEKEAKELLENLFQKDSKIALEAAKKLANYRYVEVVHGLLDVILSEYFNSKPDFPVVLDSLRSLHQLATPEFEEEIKYIQKIASEHNYGSYPEKGKEIKKILAQVADQLGNYQNRKGSLKKFTVSKFFKDKLKSNGALGQPFVSIIERTTDFLTDDLMRRIQEKSDIDILGRDEEAKAAFELLLKEKSKIPIFIGPAGVGKTTVVERMAQIIVKLKLNPDMIYDEIRGAHILSTTPARISALTKDPMSTDLALKEFLNVILAAEEKMKVPIILFINEIHTLSAKQVEVLKPFLSSDKTPIKLIGATTSEEFQLTFKNNEAIMSLSHQIPVTEFTFEQILEIINMGWRPRTEKKYNVKFSDKVIKRAIRISPTLFQHEGRLDASIDLMQSLAIWTRGERNDSSKTSNLVEIEEKDLISFAQKQGGLPVDTTNSVELSKYLEDLKEKVNQKILGQKEAVNPIVDLWGNLLQNGEDRPIRVVLAAGSTGVGKSETANVLSKHIFPGRDAVFTIDGNTYKEKKSSLYTLLGVPSGYIGTGTAIGSGALINWLDDPTKGGRGGIIIIDEADRAHQDFWAKFMEFFDKGEITGNNDGKIRKANNIIVILTSNRGDKNIFPKGAEKWSEKEMVEHIKTFSSGDKIKDLFRQKMSGQDTFQLPEPILARIDKYVVFRPISQDLAYDIANNWVEDFKNKKQKNQDIKSLTIEEGIVKYLVDLNFQAREGARAILNRLETHINKSFLDVTEKLTDKEISLSLLKGKKNKAPQIKTRVGDKDFYHELPDNREKDPYDDIAKDMDLSKQVNKEIFGQEQIVKNISEKIVSHKVNPTGRPLSIFLMGTTGTGKTQIFKSLAGALWGDSSRAEVISVGDIIHHGQLNNIFGAPKGYKGSGDMARFERFLDQNEGKRAIIVFDEASNMGGSGPESKANKEQIFKFFYEILEEGKWTSSVTDKTYDLKEKIIAFTGNDGEKIFDGIVHDDLRESRWKDSNKREEAEKILKDSGVPEAFLGRLDYLGFMKPIMAKTGAKIVKKFLDPMIKTQTGLKISYDDMFLSDLFRSLFTHTAGVRSVKSFIDTHMPESFIQARMKYGKDLSVKISLQDNLPKTPYIKDDFKERKVHLVFNIQGKTKTKTKTKHVLEKDVSDLVPKVSRPLKQEAKSTAYHEAGHAVLNDPKISGMKLAHVTIYSGGGMGGYARYDLLPGNRAFYTSLDKLIYEVSMMLGGVLSQEKAGFEFDTGMSGDYKQATKKIDAFIKSGVTSMETFFEKNKLFSQDKKFLKVLKDPKISQDKKDAMIKKTLMRAAEKKAIETLEEKSDLIKEVADILLEKGVIQGDEFEKIVDKSGSCLSLL